MVGMPDYDNYVQHMRLTHPELPVMSYEAFFRERQEARYGGADGRPGVVVDAGARERYRLDSILTFVDAVHAADQLDQHRVAAAQLGFADRLLLSKTELVDAEQLASLRLRRINAHAPIVVVPSEAAAVAELFELNAFVLDEVLALDPDFLEHQHAEASVRAGGTPGHCACADQTWP